MNILLAAAAQSLAWLRAHFLYVTLAVLVLAGAAALRACSYRRQVARVLQQSPPVLTRRQAKAVTAHLAAALAKAANATTRGDSVARAVTAKERRLPAQTRQIDRLTTRYHATTADSLPAAAVHRFLAAYRPGPDSL